MYCDDNSSCIYYYQREITKDFKKEFEQVETEKAKKKIERANKSPNPTNVTMVLTFGGICHSSSFFYSIDSFLYRRIAFLLFFDSLKIGGGSEKKIKTSLFILLFARLALLWLRLR